MLNRKRLLAALTVTAELCAAELSENAKAVFVKRLEAWPLDAVLRALDRVQIEHGGRLTLAAVVERIDDGRPAAEEAWALCPKDEMTSVWWTAEMQAAAAAARPHIQTGERIAARMTFLEVYRRQVRQARADAIPPRWELTRGLDKIGVEHALRDGLRRGLINAAHARRLLPAPDRRYCPSTTRPAQENAA